jgi:hypothetical protein
MSKKQEIYVFGYGSLISASSRARTVPNYDHVQNYAVRCHGLQRTWSLRSRAPYYTALGCVVLGDANLASEMTPPRCCCHDDLNCSKETKKMHPLCCNFRPHGYPHSLDHLPNCNSVVNGVIFAIGDVQDLQQFDVREEGYTRVRLDPRQIQLLDTKQPDMPPWLTNPDVIVYVYVLSNQRHLGTLTPIPPSSRHPLAQTYIDVCMRGCLSYSDKFAREFVAQTWTATAEMVSIEGTCLCDEKEGIECERCGALCDALVLPWVNDRQHARYRRAEIMDEQVWKQIDDSLKSVLGERVVSKRVEAPIKLVVSPELPPLVENS